MMITNNLTYKTMGLYLHIPFCSQKCHYCDFLSFDALEHEIYEEYVAALIKEIKHYGQVYNKKIMVDTVFLGGGTPTLLEEALIAEILTAVKAAFHMDSRAEITIEANPKTLNRDKLDRYLSSGINRLSIGVQSLSDDVLRTLGRAHCAKDFVNNFFLARERGFENINLDFMFAVPGHTLGIWMDTLSQAVDYAPEHISFYSLQLEEGTVFFDLFQRGGLEMISDDLDREMYHKAMGFLEHAGYPAYEISNCAKPSFECKHNLKYWSMEDYLGLGLGAHSFVSGTRFSNTRDLKQYLKEAEKENPWQSNEKKENMQLFGTVDWFHENSIFDSASEFVFTGLRRRNGIDLVEFKKRFGVDFFKIYDKEKLAIERYIREGYLISKDGKLKLSTGGIDISNRIMAEFV